MLIGMAARPIAGGNVSFGLVSIPVKLFSTADYSSAISFNWLDAKHGVRLKQQYISSKDERVVPPEERVKGYEFAKGQFVTFTEQELKALQEKASPSIEITEFVPLSEVDPLYYEKSYYLGPETGGEKAYRLLAAAMEKTGRCAIAKYAARGKQYIVLLRPFERGIVMQQLYYNNELRKFDQVPLGDDITLKDAELDLAVQLIDQIAADKFNADAYEDDVRIRVRAAIDQKIEGQEITATLEEAPKAQIVDLMEALKASLGLENADGQKSKGAKKAPTVRQAARKAGSKKAATK